MLGLPDRPGRQHPPRSLTSSRPLSVCLICTFYPPSGFGGDAVHAQRFATGLARRGHRVRVVYNPTAHRLLGGLMVPAHGDPSVEALPLPSGTGAGAATVATYLAGRAVGYRQRLSELAAGFDVVHFSNPSLLGGPGSFDIGDPAAVRLLTTHEHWLVCPTHTLFRYRREVCTRRTCWRCCVSYRRPPQPWRSTSFLPRQVRHLDTLLAPSRFTAELHRLAFPSTWVEVLPALGPMPAELHAPSSGSSARAHTFLQGNRPFFLFAGRLEPIKGPLPLAQAFAAVQGADLVVAGDGSQAEELRRLSQVIPTVRVVGRVSTADALALTRAARALVVPSNGYETFGMAALEAMTLGTPVVVRNIGPLPELVEDGGGVVFGDTEELKGTLQALVDDPEAARRMGDRARAVAAQRFGHDDHFRRWFEIVSGAARAKDHEELAAAAALAAGQEAAASSPSRGGRAGVP